VGGKWSAGQSKVTWSWKSFNFGEPVAIENNFSTFYLIICSLSNNISEKLSFILIEMKLVRS
jgi:hypothetical protein